MNTRLLMATSAIVLGLIGVIFSFLPEEVAHFLNFTEPTSIVFQILGALYFGFAILNWTAKGNLIGGIYSRPVAIGNFSHFLIGGLALIKIVMHENNYRYLWPLAVIYTIFALLFGYIMFTGPGLKGKEM